MAPPGGGNGPNMTTNGRAMLEIATIGLYPRGSFAW